LCEKFHCLPSQLLAEDASLLQMVNLVGFGKTDEGGADTEEGGPDYA